MTDNIKIKEIRELTKTRNHPYWRIDWFGQIFENSAIENEYLMEVGLSAINNPNSNRHVNVGTSLPQTTTVKIGVGQLPAIQLGTKFDNGNMVGFASGKKLDISIDTNEIGANQIILAGSKLDKRRFLIPQWEVNLAAYKAFDSHCLLFKVTDRSKRSIDIILPCMVLIRAYYAISTRLAKAVFDGTVANNLNSLINVEKSIMSETTCIVTRRKNVSDIDCYVLGMLIADNNAMESACSVYHSMATAKRNQRPLHPKSWFPFKGPTRLEVEGAYMDKANDDRFLVRRIINCNRRPPYKKLVVIADNDARTAPPETDIPDENKSEAWDKTKTDNVPDDGTLQSVLEANSSFDVKHIAGTENLFSGFVDIAIKKLPKERCEYKNAGITIDGTDYPKTSLGTGDSRSPPTGVKPTSINQSKKLPAPPAQHGFCMFEEMIEIVNLMPGMQAKLKPGTSGLGLYAAINTNTKAKRNWSYINNHTRVLRQIIIGEVIYNNHKFLVLDIEPRPPMTKGFKVEVITTSNGDDISEESLCFLIKNLSMHKGIMNNIINYPPNVMRVGNGLKHTWDTANKFAGKVTNLIFNHS